MSTVTLRPYQERDLDRIRASYAAGHKAPLYQAPCGAGKTRMFARICAGAAAKGTRVLILAHRVELVEQIAEALFDEGTLHSYIASGFGYRSGMVVYIASVLSVVRRTADCSPDLIIVDEAHHAIPRTTWGKILAHYPRARILGVSATPERLSGEGLSDIFDDLIVGPTHEELIREGYLTGVRVFAPPTIDTEGLHTRAGDYKAEEVERLVDRPTVTGDCIEHYQRLAAGRRAIVFDVSVDAARRRAAAFREAGYTAECIDGETPRDVRALAVANFRSGRIQILTSCDLVSEGFDLPAIEVGISLRPTRSLALWLQQSGRILRPFPGKETAVLFDHAGNTLRLGFPTEERAWSLAGTAATAHRDEPRRSLRTCAACYAVSPGCAVVCRECGAAFPTQPRSIREVDGELEEVSESKARDTIKAARGQAQTLQALIELGKMRGMKNPWGWAQHVMAARARKRRIA